MRTLRCAIYTRVSTEHGLEQEFNSLDNQREASEAYVKSQAHEGWRALSARYDDGGFSGASIDRPALQRLLADIRAGLIDVVVVYKVDRLTRSLSDFAKLVELFDQNGVSSGSICLGRPRPAAASARSSAHPLKDRSAGPCAPRPGPGCSRRSPKPASGSTG